MRLCGGHSRHTRRLAATCRHQEHDRLNHGENRVAGCVGLSFRISLLTWTKQGESSGGAIKHFSNHAMNPTKETFSPSHACLSFRVRFYSGRFLLEKVRVRSVCRCTRYIVGCLTLYHVDFFDKNLNSQEAWIAMVVQMHDDNNEAIRWWLVWPHLWSTVVLSLENAHFALKSWC